MRRFIGLCLLAVVTCSAGFAKGRSPQNDPPTKKEVISFLDALTEAGLKRDVAALDRFYSDGYFHTNPDGSIMTKAQVLASYKAPPTGVTESDRHDEDKIWISGNVASVNTRVTLRGRLNNHPYERRYRLTYLFEKAQGGWRAVTSHATLILPASK